MGIYAEGMSGSLLALSSMMREPLLFDAISVHNPVTDLPSFIYQQNKDNPMMKSILQEEFGDIENPDIYKVLRMMSPYHISFMNQFKYQTDLLMTFDKNKPVHAAHTRKFIAKMREINHHGDHMFMKEFSEFESDPVINKMYNYSFLALSLLFRTNKDIKSKRFLHLIFNFILINYRMLL